VSRVARVLRAALPAGAQSIAVSGGYEDDEDHGNWCGSLTNAPVLLCQGAEVPALPVTPATCVLCPTCCARRAVPDARLWPLRSCAPLLGCCTRAVWRVPC
jgi:hypothetical protein